MSLAGAALAVRRADRRHVLHLAGLCLRRAAVIALAVFAASVVAVPPASADEAADEQALARQYAPVVLLRTQAEPCDRQGDAYFPVAVETFLGRDDVTLVGPDGELIKAPTAADIAGKGANWYLDFPGNPLRPGCDFERWFQTIAKGHPATMYAHVAHEDGQTALQYWLYYVFNDWNNTHEGDWEMLQIMFDAPTATAALQTAPTEVGFSQHTGGERSAWAGGSVQLDGVRPVVFPAAGSHAQFFSNRLWMGFSAETGIGCDDTRTPSTRIEPKVVLLPDSPPATGSFAWVSFAGLWGERVRGPYSGPTGPAEKRQWDEPVGWTDGWRNGSLAVPEGNTLGPTSTSVFCGGIAAGSVALLRLLYDPLTTLVVLAALILLGIFLTRRTQWRPLTPHPIDRTRPAGVMLRDAWRIYLQNRRVLLTIGAVSVPLGILGTVWAESLVRVTGLESLLDTSEGGHAVFGGISVLLMSGGIATLVPLVLVTMAVAAAMGDLAAGEAPRLDWRRTAERVPAVAGGVLVVIAIQTVLVLTVVGAVLALVVLVVTSLVIPCCVIERCGAREALRRSRELVRGRSLRVFTVTILANGLALLAGPLVGLALLFLQNSTVSAIDIVSSIVYVAVLPYAAVVQTLLFYDARARRAARVEADAVKRVAAPADRLY